jgi:hypothetical protein
MEPPREAPDALPAGVLLLPILPPRVDQEGRPVGEVQVLLAQQGDGTVIAEAYTSPGHLVTARGKLQPWVAVRRRDLAELLDRQNVSKLVVDAGSPDGYELDRDGARRPLLAALSGVDEVHGNGKEDQGGAAE